MDSLRRDPFLLSALAPAADLCARVGDPAQAQVLYDAILPYAHLHGNVSTGVSTAGPMERHLGILAIRIGDARRAEGHLQRAVKAAEAMPSPPFLALCCIALARLLLKGGRREARARAAELLARAHAVAKAAGLWAIARHGRDIAQHAALELPASRASGN